MFCMQNTQNYTWHVVSTQLVLAIIINILLRTRGIYPSEKLKAGVHLTDFYFAEWGMGADGFWLYNVLLNGDWEFEWI